MSLAVRLLLFFVLFAALVTGLVGISVRDVAQYQVEQGFKKRIEVATAAVQQALVWEMDGLSKALASGYCANDAFIGQTLSDWERNKGSVQRLLKERGIAIQKLVVDQRKAMRFDVLLLVTGEGDVLGASDLRLVGTQRKSFAQLLRGKPGALRLVGEGPKTAIEVHCTLRRGKLTLGLVGIRLANPILQRIGESSGVSLRLATAKQTPVGAVKPSDQLQRRLTFNDIPGLAVTATTSRKPLKAALRSIDRSILLAGAIAVLLSIFLAVFIASGLSRPIVELAHQTRAIVRGSPEPVRSRGGRELAQLARTFNRTIDELTTMRKRLAHSERIAARREIARQVAHEIKNPLAPIRAAVETLRRLRDRGRPEFDEYFDEATVTVLNEVHRIQEIVTEFTKFARMPAPKFDRIDLVDVARGVVKLHDSIDTQPGDTQTGSRNSGPRVRLEHEPLPPILADHDQLVQVLTNLVQNGIEAVQSSDAMAGVRPEITVGLRREGDHAIIISVADNGPGVATELRDKLFEPYVSDKPEGTGLGLAIVQRIVHEHGGGIDYRDGAAGGAVFEVSLPIDGPPLLDQPPETTG